MGEKSGRQLSESTDIDHKETGGKPQVHSEQGAVGEDKDSPSQVKRHAY